MRVRRLLLICVLYGALSAIFCAPLFAHPAGLGNFDWDQHLFYYAQVLKNVVEYAQPPFWSPWYCGGNVLWQNPQIALLSPVYPLTAIMPLALAMKVSILLHYWVGFIGMHLLLTEVIGLTFLPLVVYLAAVFTLGGANALHLAVGHSVFLPAFYLPWQLLFFFRALKTGALRPALYAGAIVALMIYNGGLHIVPMALLAIGVFSVCTSVAHRSWRPMLLAVLIGVSGAAYAAPKLVPVSLFVTSDRFWDTRNPITHPDRMTPAMLVRAYVDPSQTIESKFSDWQRHGWWEYGNYVGSFAILLIAASILWALLARSGPEHSFAVALALTSLLFLVLSAGEFSAFAPALLLRRVPFFSSFRIPSRFTIAFVLFGTLTAGAFARALGDKIVWSRARQACVAAVCTIALFQLTWVNSAQFRGVFSVAPLGSGFRVLNGSGTLVRDSPINPYAPGSPMLRALMSDQAVSWCYESLQLTRGAEVDRPLFWSDGASKISPLGFTPNRVQFSVIGGIEPAKVFLNQNYAAGWRSSAGPVRLDPQAGGRMYVQLAPGQTGKFSFSFAPPGLIPGVALLLLAVGLSALVWHRRLPPLGIVREDAEPHATRAVPFATRAEHVTKFAMLGSIVMAIAVEIMFAGDVRGDLTLIAGVSFSAACLLSLFWADAIAAVLVFTYVAPALVAHVWVNNPVAYHTIWMAGLVGAMWPRSTSPRWMLPAPWRVPLVGWGLAAAVTWPIIVARELDFNLQPLRSIVQPISAMGFPAPTSVVLTAEAAATLMLGVLWLDWLFATFAEDEHRFRRRVIAPLLVSCAAACAVAAYQWFGHITFLNAGWGQFGRAGGTMFDANGLGMVAVLGSCGFVAWMDHKRVAWKVVMLAGVALTLAGLWASGSKTALIAELIASAFVLWSVAPRAAHPLRVRSRRRRMMGVGLACVVAGSLLFALRDSGPARRVGWIVPGTSVQAAELAKQLLWDRDGYGTAAVEMIRKNPWFGVGVGAYAVMVGDYPYSHFKSSLAPDNAQNWIRHQLAELGVIGSVGWMTWAVVLAATTVKRKAAATAGRRAAIVGGALVAVVVVSQVGMPTQNLAVAITFWTFLFWYILLRSVPETGEASTSPVASWTWMLMAILLLVYAGGTLHAAITTLQVPLRARNAGWRYSYGLYATERTGSGEEFRWTEREAVAVLAAPKRVVKVTIWVNRRDIAASPVHARVWHDQDLVIDTVFHDNKPVTTFVVIEKRPQWLMLRTNIDGVELPTDSGDPAVRELGLAIQWTFLDTLPVGAP